jgi:hypothetical protein
VQSNDFFEKIKEGIANIDPVRFVENYLTIDGEPFNLSGRGYKPFADIYRYVGIKALEPTGKPVILVKGRQVGGTVMACALEQFFMGSGLFGNDKRPPMRIIHAFPILEQAAVYSKTQFSQMIGNSKIISKSNVKNGIKPKSYMQNMLDTSTPTNDSLHFKQFIGGNYIFIDSVGVDADRIRGRTADVMFFDECQDINGTAITNATKVLTASKYGSPGNGVQVYFGTPKKKGSDFYKMWQSSNQQYYYLGCESCKKHFPLYTPDSDEWERIWLHGFIVKCTHCGHEQDKRTAAERGKWIGSKDPEDCLMIGFHINQLYMPHFTKEKILSEKPGTHPINTERAYKNEVLGEFYQGDTSPITIEEIHQMCGDKERKMRAHISPNSEQMVIMGIDYGARADLEQMANPEKSSSRGQSFSTAVVLSVKGPSLFSVEFATKFKRNDLESKKSLIEQIMKQYSVELAVGDIGFSQDFSTIMHQAYGDKYLVSRAQNKVNNHVKYNQDIFPKEIVFERDFYIGEFFDLLKKGQIKFPYGDYDKIGWLIAHCASMEIKPSISKYGDPSIHYVKGSSPNDGLMAMLNAYIAYKFLISKGFTENNPLLQKNTDKKEKPPIVLGVIKRNF